MIFVVDGGGVRLDTAQVSISFSLLGGVFADFESEKLALTFVDCAVPSNYD